MVGIGEIFYECTSPHTSTQPLTGECIDELDVTYSKYIVAPEFGILSKRDGLTDEPALVTFLITNLGLHRLLFCYPLAILYLVF